MLGYSWQPKHDLLSLEKKTIDLIPNKGKIVNPRPSLDQQFQDKRLFTKRSLLSLSLRLFDPLGLFCPVYGEAKLAIQEVVTTTDGWDTPVADKYKPTFRSIINTLTQIPSIHIPAQLLRREGGLSSSFCRCESEFNVRGCLCAHCRQHRARTHSATVR